MDKATREGVLFTLAAASGYALFPIFTKTIYRFSDGFGATDIAGWRFLMAVPLTWLMVYLRGQMVNSVAMTERLPRFRLMGLGTLLATGALAGFYGLSLIDVSLFTIIFRTMPVLVLLISWLLGEKLPLKGWAALAVVLIGVVLVMNPGNVAIGWSRTDFLGVGVAFLNAVVIAFYTVGQGRLSAGYKAKVKATAWTMTGALAALVPVMLLHGLHLPPNWQVFGSVFGLVVCSTVLPLIAILEGLTRLGASRFAIMNSMEPVLTLFLAFILLGESLLPVQLMGGALILTSVLLLEAPLPRLGRKPRPLEQPIQKEAVAPGGD